MHKSYEIDYSDLEQKGILEDGSIKVTYVREESGIDTMLYGHDLDIRYFSELIETTISQNGLRELESKHINEKRSFITGKIDLILQRASNNNIGMSA